MSKSGVILSEAKNLVRFRMTPERKKILKKFFTAAVLVAVIALPVMAGKETGTLTGEVAAPVMPARGEAKEVDPGHWVAHLRDDRFIDLIAPKGNERVWTVVGPDEKPKPQLIEEKAEPGAPEGVRRFQVRFQYVGSDGGEVAALVTGTIVESVRGLVRVIDVFDIPEQRVRVVHVPGPERVVTVTKKKKKTEWWPILLAGGLVYALTAGGDDGDGGGVTPEGRLVKYCPFWRNHVAADHAAGRNTDRGTYSYPGDTWEEVDRKLNAHLFNDCPFAKQSPGWTGDPSNPWDPQNGGPGVGDSLIQSRNGEPELGISLDRLGLGRSRLMATVQGLNLQAHLRGELGFSVSQDGSWEIGNEWLGFSAGPGDRQFAIAAKLGGVNLRLSNFGGDWMAGVSGSLSF